MTFNTEFFIETVQKFPVLYDTSHHEYKNIRMKNKVWDSIAEILGERDGDSLKRHWKNLRDAYSKHLRSRKTSTGQAAKLTGRYKTWPWAKPMTFLRPHLEFAETHSNIRRNASSQSTIQWNVEEPGFSQSPNTSIQINTAQSQSNALSQSQQVDKVINDMSNIDKDDDTDLLFKSYSKKLKKMTNRRQATVKFEIAKIMLKAELEEFDEMDSGSNVEQYFQNKALK